MEEDREKFDESEQSLWKLERNRFLLRLTGLYYFWKRKYARVFREWESSVKTWQTGKSCQFKLTNSRMNRKKKRISKIKIPSFILAFVTNENLSSDFEFTFVSKFFSWRTSVLQHSVLLLTDRAKRNSVKRASLKKAERRSAMSSSRFTNRALG